jgi:tRNA (mo5U34)-methyltransferase
MAAASGAGGLSFRYGREVAAAHRRYSFDARIDVDISAPHPEVTGMTLTELDATSTGIKFDRETLAQRVRQLPWFHSIDLGHGIVTPGTKSPAIHRAECAAIFDPVALSGRSAIDIGAWNGAYSFEAKRRGAARVLATDHYAWNHPLLRGRGGFELARSVLNVDVEVKDIDIPYLTPDSVGTFDVVLLLGVFYHLLDPIAALQQVAKLAREVLIVETHTDALEIRRPAMIMYPGEELDNDGTNWWGPNPACMVALLRQCGFAKVDAAWSNVGYRSVYHAWRTDALRRFADPDERVIDVPHAMLLRGRRMLGRGRRLISKSLGLRRAR